MIKESEIFYNVIKRLGSGQLYISIPVNVVEFGEYKQGDQVKVMIQKKETEQKEE
jgi:hypothetical protein